MASKMKFMVTQNFSGILFKLKVIDKQMLTSNFSQTMYVSTLSYPAVNL